MPCKVSIKEDFKKLEEIYPNLCKNTAEQFLKEKDFNGYICTYNSLTRYYDQVWIFPDMFEVPVNDPVYGITLKNPLSSLIRKDVSEDIWETFQEACKEQYNNDFGNVCFSAEIENYTQYFRISKEDILVV